uniref:A-kinase anchor protein 7-like phosphoesterase domain-containing protein n=1 Tax=Hucho hucho TaxID=62062 RepID=A0A4W5NG96_9TELE
MFLHMNSLIIGIHYCMFHFKCDHKATAGTEWPASEWHALLVQISVSVGAVQALVMQRDSRLTRALVPVASLHITLLVTHLASQEEVNLAVCAVDQMKASLQDLLRGRELILPFHGIGHFRVGQWREPCQTGPDRRACKENV